MQRLLRCCPFLNLNRKRQKNRFSNHKKLLSVKVDATFPRLCFCDVFEPSFLRTVAFRRTVLSAICPVGQLNYRQIVLSANRPISELSCRWIVLPANSSVAKLFCRQTVSSTNYPSANCPSPKRPCSGSAQQLSLKSDESTVQTIFLIISGLAW